MNSPPLPSTSFFALLNRLSPELNARFRKGIAQGLRIENHDWMTLVQTTIVPNVESVLATNPKRAQDTFLAIYDVAMELAIAGQFSQVERTPILTGLWQAVFPSIPQILSADPRIVAGSLSNAAIHLSQVAPHATLRWLDQLTRLAPDCQGPSELLKLGMFLAWTSGFAACRKSALDLADQLPLPLLTNAMQLGSTAEPGLIQSQLAELKRNPWYDASRTEDSSITRVGQCGDFIGFGGVFNAPPIVGLVEGALCAHDETHSWQLFADRFGHSFRRREVVPWNPPDADDTVHITNQGVVHWEGQQIEFPDLALPRSQAFDGSTLAVTLTNSYRIYLVARPGK